MKSTSPVLRGSRRSYPQPARRLTFRLWKVAGRVGSTTRCSAMQAPCTQGIRTRVSFAPAVDKRQSPHEGQAAMLFKLSAQRPRPDRSWRRPVGRSQWPARSIRRTATPRRTASERQTQSRHSRAYQCGRGLSPRARALPRADRDTPRRGSSPRLRVTTRAASRA